MKKYRVEITEVENTYCYTGEWDSDFMQDDINAVSADEAIEIAKDIINADGGNADDYLFRIKEERPYVDDKDKAEVLEAVKSLFVEYNKKDYNEAKFMEYSNKLNDYDPYYAQYISLMLPEEPDYTRDWENEDYSELL